MPFGLRNAPQIYQRLIDNDLYGFLKLRSTEQTRRREAQIGGPSDDAKKLKTIHNTNGECDSMSVNAIREDIQTPCETKDKTNQGSGAESNPEKESRTKGKSDRDLDNRSTAGKESGMENLIRPSQPVQVTNQQITPARHAPGNALEPPLTEENKSESEREDVFKTGVPEDVDRESVLKRRSYIDDILFGGRT